MGYGQHRPLVGLWDVEQWTLGPRRPFRMNALCRVDAVIVTVAGRLETAAAAQALSTVLRPFEQLPSPLTLDLFRAVIDDQVAAVVVAAWRLRTERGAGLRVVHADAAAGRRLACAARRGDRSGPHHAFATSCDVCGAAHAGPWSSDGSRTCACGGLLVR